MISLLRRMVGGCGRSSPSRTDFIEANKVYILRISNGGGFASLVPEKAPFERKPVQLVIDWSKSTNSCKRRHNKRTFDASAL
jgi:hypothetical protein